MDKTELKDLIDMLRENGVTEYVSEGLTLKLTPQAPKSTVNPLNDKLAQLQKDPFAVVKQFANKTDVRYMQGINSQITVDELTELGFAGVAPQSKKPKVKRNKEAS
jgi:ribosomal protein L11